MVCLIPTSDAELAADAYRERYGAKAPSDADKRRAAFEAADAAEMNRALQDENDSLQKHADNYHQLYDEASRKLDALMNMRDSLSKACARIKDLEGLSRNAHKLLRGAFPGLNENGHIADAALIAATEHKKLKASARSKGTDVSTVEAAKPEPPLVPCKPGYWWRKPVDGDVPAPWQVHNHPRGHLTVGRSGLDPVEDDGSWRGPCLPPGEEWSP